MAIKTTSQLIEFNNDASTPIGGKLAYYSNNGVLTENDINAKSKFTKDVTLTSDNENYYSSFFEISKPKNPGEISPNEEYQSMKVGYYDILKNIIWDVKAYLNYRHSLNDYDLSCIVDGEQKFSGNKTFNKCDMVVDNTLSVGKQLSAIAGTFANGISAANGTFTNIKCGNLSVTNFISGYAYGLKDNPSTLTNFNPPVDKITYGATRILGSGNTKSDRNYYNLGGATVQSNAIGQLSNDDGWQCVTHPITFRNGRPKDHTTVKNALRLVVAYDDDHIHTADVEQQLKRLLPNLSSQINFDSRGCIISGYGSIENLSASEPDFYKYGTVTTFRGGSPYPQNSIGFAYYAKHAFWSDLGEKYLADAKYEPGTLVKFGGEKEITIADDEVNAIVSTNAFDLNSCLKDGTVIALCGRVPTKVKGKIQKFDKIMLSDIPGIACKWDGKSRVIGRALESNDNEDVKLVECVTRFEI